MKTLEFLIGIPASGKSTYAKEKCLESGGSCVRVNKDDIREAHPNWNEKQVKEHQVEEIKSYMIFNYPTIIVDNTHLNPVHETSMRALAEKWGYEFKVIWFEDSLTPDVCHKRNILRGDACVPHYVIETMYDQYFKLWMELQGHKIVMQGMPAIIVDIDGTIATNKGTRGWYDWKAVGSDAVVPPIVELVKTMTGMFPECKVIFMTGRDTVCLQETSKWLTDVFTENIAGIPWDLHMRAKGDMRKDSIVKWELFMNYVNNYYDVKYVLDDRLQVVRQWRAMGLTCLQVANGWF